jgi:hypothetical protein
MLDCGTKPIRRLPALESCKKLLLLECAQFRGWQQLPAGLTHFECRGCSTMQQLPEQLPADLQTLDCSACSVLQQLPQQLPAGLTHQAIASTPMALMPHQRCYPIKP